VWRISEEGDEGERVVWRLRACTKVLSDRRDGDGCACGMAWRHGMVWRCYCMTIRKRWYEWTDCIPSVVASTMPLSVSLYTNVRKTVYYVYYST